MTPPRTVLLTGASGRIAGQLLPALRDAYDLRLVDVKDTDRAGEQVTGVEIFDVLEAHPDSLAALCEGVDTIVHAGYVTDGAARGYASERSNVDMTQRIYDAATTAGVRRVVCASTNQASKWYEQPYYQGRIDRVSVDDYPRPDSFYGWAKVAYESLGFLYACGSLGTQLEVVQIRIVAPREIDSADFRDRPLQHYLRDIAGYISERDLQQLFVKCIETADIRDRFGVPFQIFYGVSNNARTFWSITNAREVVDYQPVDDSEVKFAEQIAAMVRRG
ncbi:MAG: UDP-glucose 4-epimerase [uncultured Propionibacteriaceae bacterium]|uniref:UDP-glucose 4-epimerase n=1 Tax=uncultured Propionibacteriaceae bacterium TaxID=257457 RepID=A0A6J4PAF1_9ACTN|nr:MAG: UDP-glucose 4-epimerase [uncultured Propionibacteriaceae bacterium]